MNAIRLLLDEDVYGAVATALRRSGIDAVSTIEAGRGGESDESQLDWAAGENRALFTFSEQLVTCSVYDDCSHPCRRVS